jgi:hypothetical protein
MDLHLAELKSLSKRLLPGLRVNVVSPGDTWFPDGFWRLMSRWSDAEHPLK